MQVIDKLLVEIGLTSDKFKKNVDEVVKQFDRLKKAEQDLYSKGDKAELKKTNEVKKGSKARSKLKTEEIKQTKKQLEEADKQSEELSKREEKRSSSLSSILVGRLAPAALAYKAIGSAWKGISDEASIANISGALIDSEETISKWNYAFNVLTGKASLGVETLANLQKQIAGFQKIGRAHV